MAEATETAPNQTEAATSTETAAAVLLGTEADATTTQQTTETTAAEPAKTEEAGKPEVKVEGAPEKYEFKAPEGQSYDAGILTAFEAAARDSNLSQTAAQKLLDSMAPKIAERQMEQVVAIRKEWYESSKSDKEFGGEKLDQNLGIAKKALDNFGSPELNKLLVSTGLGNHPEVIRAFFKIGKAISEDTFVNGQPSAKPQDVTAILYPTMNKE